MEEENKLSHYQKYKDTIKACGKRHRDENREHYREYWRSYRQRIKEKRERELMNQLIEKYVLQR